MNLRLLRTILLIGVILNPIASFCQRKAVDYCTAPIDSITRKPVFQVVDTPAEVNGGISAMGLAISKGLKLPSKIERLAIDSKIFVGFVVDEHGKVTGQRIIKNIEGTNIAEQVLTIISDFKWKPGRCHGKPVSTFHIYPMTICLN